MTTDSEMVVVADATMTGRGGVSTGEGRRRDGDDTSPRPPSSSPSSSGTRYCEEDRNDGGTANGVNGEDGDRATTEDKPADATTTATADDATANTATANNTDSFPGNSVATDGTAVDGSISETPGTSMITTTPTTTRRRTISKVNDLTTNGQNTNSANKKRKRRCTPASPMVTDSLAYTGQQQQRGRDETDNLEALIELNFNGKHFNFFEHIENEMNKQRRLNNNRNNANDGDDDISVVLNPFRLSYKCTQVIRSIYKKINGERYRGIPKDWDEKVEAYVQAKRETQDTVVPTKHDDDDDDDDGGVDAGDSLLTTAAFENAESSSSSSSSSSSPTHTAEEKVFIPASASEDSPSATDTQMPTGLSSDFKDVPSSTPLVGDDERETILTAKYSLTVSTTTGNDKKTWRGKTGVLDTFVEQRFDANYLHFLEYLENEMNKPDFSVVVFAGECLGQKGTETLQSIVTALQTGKMIRGSKKWQSWIDAYKQSKENKLPHSTAANIQGDDEAGTALNNDSMTHGICESMGSEICDVNNRSIRETSSAHDRQGADVCTPEQLPRMIRRGTRANTPQVHEGISSSLTKPEKISTTTPEAALATGEDHIDASGPNESPSENHTAQIAAQQDDCQEESPEKDAEKRVGTSSNLLGDILFVVPSDRELISEAFYIALQQMIPCNLVESDRGRKERKALDIGHPGIQCMHCFGEKAWRYFTASEDRIHLPSLCRRMVEHLTKCEDCPDAIRGKLLKAREKTRTTCNTDDVKRFTHHLWCRIQNIPLNESSGTDSDHFQTCRGHTFVDPDAPKLTSNAETIQENSQLRQHVAKGKPKRSHVAHTLAELDLHTENDVLGKSVKGYAKHKGNIKFRKFIDGYKPNFLNTVTSERRNFALEVVSSWRKQTPPGQFLAKGRNGLFDIGDKEAFIKVYKALRETRYSVGKELAAKSIKPSNSLARELEVDMVPAQLSNSRKRTRNTTVLCQPTIEGVNSDLIIGKHKEKRQKYSASQIMADESSGSVSATVSESLEAHVISKNRRKEKRQQDVQQKKTPRDSSGSASATASERLEVQDPSGEVAESSGVRSMQRILKNMEDAKRLQKSVSPSNTYVEEIVFLHQNPVITLEDLQPLPQAVTLPVIPEHLSAWASWQDEQQRIFLADFSDVKAIPDEAKEFLSQMMQRDDITVITQGVMHGFRQELWSRAAIDQTCGSRWYHKFRHFQWNSVKETYVEQNGYISMKISDFCKYLQQREMFLKQKDDRCKVFHFVSGQEIQREATLDVENDVIYMLDLDMTKLLPRTYQDFIDNFKIKEMLPGGDWCMMSKVPQSGRPFMGPNLYITPAGSFTHLHQDGHGTVDSGHYNVTGYNEVIMLRRMPEIHKRNACRMVPGASDKYDALYGKPHDSESGIVRPDWPTVDTVSKWRAMNYYPSILVLKPGQHIHINKGRLHAFRKLETRVLPATDCHAQLRKNLVESENLKVSPLCVSVAFDWMFMGTTSDGINREVAACLECASLNRTVGVKSLAIPETALLCQARTVALPSQADFETTPFVSSERSMFCVPRYSPNSMDICRGILPSLRYVIGKSIDSIRDAKTKKPAKMNDFARCEKVTVAPRPDTFENPDEFNLDPDGADYFCRLCHRELSNVYMHCEGCEELLQKDYNICVECHAEQRYATFCQMNTKTNKRRSIVNHTGNMSYDRSSRCPCKNGPACGNCGYCVGCSCRCHTWFRVHKRFHEDTELEALQTRLEAAVVGHGGPIKFDKETELRLRLGGISVDGRGANNASDMTTSSVIAAPSDAVGTDETRPPGIVAVDLKGGCKESDPTVE